MQHAHTKTLFHTPLQKIRYNKHRKLHTNFLKVTAFPSIGFPIQEHIEDFLLRLSLIKFISMLGKKGWHGLHGVNPTLGNAISLEKYV
jgi:hypothetical protein